MSNKNTYNITKSTVGLIEENDCLSGNVSLHFNEWWNGEGIDFDFIEGNSGGEKRISLHSDEMTALVVAAVASGHVCLDEIKEKTENMISKSKKHEENLQKFKDEYIK